MKSRNLSVFAVILSISGPLPALLPAQVTRADYERAANLRSQLQPPALNLPERPWIGKTNRFCCRKEEFALSQDGSEGDYYTFASIAWFPDSKKLAAYRLRRGYRRIIPYVQSSAADQLQPKHLTMEYAKPGDHLDIDRPSDFDPKREYSVIEKIYARPQDSFVPKSFSPYNPMQSLAELGFVVAQVDGMGRSNTSEAFRDPVKNPAVKFAEKTVSAVGEALEVAPVSATSFHIRRRKS